MITKAVLREWDEQRAWAKRWDQAAVRQQLAKQKAILAEAFESLHRAAELLEKLDREINRGLIEYGS